MAFVGMHPVLTQVPPNNLRSAIATFMPAAVKRPAREGPACPVPMMMASYFCMRVLLWSQGLPACQNTAFEYLAPLEGHAENVDALSACCERQNFRKDWPISMTGQPDDG